MTYSHMGTPTLPSAMHRFTSEFGMESGGTSTLLSPGKAFWGARVENKLPDLIRELVTNAECLILRSRKYPTRQQAKPLTVYLITYIRRICQKLVSCVISEIDAFFKAIQ